jgi:hypothetical protein
MDSRFLWFVVVVTSFVLSGICIKESIDGRNFICQPYIQGWEGGGVITRGWAGILSHFKCPGSYIMQNLEEWVPSFFDIMCVKAIL